MAADICGDRVGVGVPFGVMVEGCRVPKAYLLGVIDAYATMLFVIENHCKNTPRATLRAALYLLKDQREADVRRFACAPLAPPSTPESK